MLGIEAGTLAVGRSRPTSASSIRDAHWKVERATLASQGKNTPFLGLEVPGRVRYTLVGGQIVHDERERRVRATAGHATERNASPRSMHRTSAISRLRSLSRRPQAVDRRGFVVTSLAAGFALAVLPVSAQTITTPSGRPRPPAR